MERRPFMGRVQITNCPKCGVLLVEGVNWYQFPTRGKRYRCKACTLKYAAEWRKAHPRNVARKSRTRNWKEHGVVITFEEFEQKLLAQSGRCMICGKQPAKKRNLHVDHNHTTGQVRDILCVSCNYIIGILENPQLPKYLEYLKRWKQEQH